MLARETQRIEAQGTHEVFLAKQLELSEAGIDIKNKHIFEFYKTVSSKGNLYCTAAAKGSSRATGSLD